LINQSLDFFQLTRQVVGNRWLLGWDAG